MTTKFFIEQVPVCQSPSVLNQRRVGGFDVTMGRTLLSPRKLFGGSGDRNPDRQSRERTKPYPNPCVFLSPSLSEKGVWDPWVWTPDFLPIRGSVSLFSGGPSHLSSNPTGFRSVAWQGRTRGVCEPVRVRRITRTPTLESLFVLGQRRV